LVLFLYLQRNGTREVTFIEQPIAEGVPELSARAQADQDQQEQPAPFASDYWMQSLFQPTEQRFQEVDDPQHTDTAEGDVSSATAGPGDPVPMFAVQNSKTVVFTQRYDVGVNGCWVEYRIQYQLYVGGPAGIGTYSGDFNHELSLVSKATDSNCLFYVKNDSPFVLGAYDNPIHARIKTYGNGTSEGDVMLKGKYNAEKSQRKIWPYGEVSVSLGLDLRVASVEWTLPICCEANVPATDWKIFSSPDPSKWTKLADFTFRDRALWYKGERFIVIVQVAYGSGKNKAKPISAQWTVPIYIVGEFNHVSYVTTDSSIVEVLYASGKV
jgi:hypothetical protein